MVEPIFGERVEWRAMAFVGGATVYALMGEDRAGMVAECLRAVADAGIEGTRDDTEG